MGTKTLRIIYYLSRDGQLEEPHLLEVPQTAFNNRGVHLIDVKKWLVHIRGKSMPPSFSWSYRRNYKGGCIWQDVSADEDLILPASEGEYILKGSKLVGPSKEVWQCAPIFTQEDQTSLGMQSKFDDVVRVQEEVAQTSLGMQSQYDDVVRVNELVVRVKDRRTTESSADNEQEANVGKDSCQITSCAPVHKIDVLIDQDCSPIDHTSSLCVTANDCLLSNSDLLTLQSAHRLAQDSNDANGRGETKMCSDPGNAILDLRHGHPSTTSARLMEQAKSDTTHSDDQMDRLVSGMSIAEHVRLHHIVDNHAKHQPFTKRETCESLGGARHHVDLALASRRAMTNTTALNSNGCEAPAGNRAVTCSLVKNATYHKPLKKKPLKYTRSNNIWERVSCKAVDVNVIECEDKTIKHPNKVLAMQKRIKTIPGCSLSPVSLTHVTTSIAGDMSACKQQGIGDRVPLQERKVSSKRVSYSDELGVELPATMVIRDIALDKSESSFHKFESSCPVHQRLPARQAPVSSSHLSAYGHKNATSQYLQRPKSLPVFGYEKQQQQLTEKLDLFCTPISDTSFERRPTELQSSCVEQLSKLPSHEQSCPENTVAQNINLSRSFSGKGIKILWEELLQTTQHALAHHETV